jgi:hypothetical protein
MSKRSNVRIVKETLVLQATAGGGRGSSLDAICRSWPRLTNGVWMPKSVGDSPKAVYRARTMCGSEVQRVRGSEHARYKPAIILLGSREAGRGEDVNH